jgi:hypothetical protein
VPSATDQVSKYLGDAISKKNKADGLFIIAIGANDAFFDVNVTAAETTRNIVRMMKKLRDHGECYMFYPQFGGFHFVFSSKAQNISSLHRIPICLVCLSVPIRRLPLLGNFTHIPPISEPHCKL